MFTLHRKVSLVAVLIAGIALFFFTNRLNAQDLVNTSLRSKDFAEDVTVFADEALVADDISHPLGSGEFAQAIAAQDEAIYQYDSGYKFGAMVPTVAVAVGHFQYQYATAEIADKVAALVVQRFATAPTTTIVEQNLSDSARGYRVKMIGDEGDLVYWFVGNRDNVLSLIMVNGFDENMVSKTFEYVLPIALNK